MYGRGQRSFAPIKIGDELDVKIEAVGEKGDGIAKKDGFVIFVPGVKEGDEVHIKVNKVLRRVGFAEVVGKEAPGPSEETESTEETEESPQETEEAAEPKEEIEDTEDFGEEKNN